MVPYRTCGVFTKYEELCTSLYEVHKQVSNSSLHASEEGAVLTFILRRGEGSATPDTVISMCKVKSVEYQALRLIVDVLQGAADNSLDELSKDKLFTQFVRDLKVFSRNIDEAFEQHPETFYIDLFSTAHTLLAKKSA